MAAKPPPRRLRWLAACAALACLAPPGGARAQTCTTGPRTPFAGHAFPLDSVPDPTPMLAVRAWPNLTLAQPVFLTAPPDASGRTFVVERGGRIRILPDSQSGSTAPIFLDLASEVVTFGPEQGLLGLAFDPGFASNRRFYVNYVAPGSRCDAGSYCTKVERYLASAADPNVADPTSRLELLQIARSNVNHNGGMLAFGPDGMLYVSSGDDGPENAQDLGVLKGKLLRIDPNGGTPYAIPPDNPYVGQPDARAEIWAYGFRNPWRFSFDRLTGDLWIGDVGQDAWEEVDFVAAGAGFERNFGWPVCEATHDYDGDCSALASTLPVAEYPHGGSGGFSITGGYVYRGDRLPSLHGAYLYADYVSGRVWARSGPAGPSTQIATVGGISSFGEDALGELYLVELAGRIFRLEPSADPGTQQFPTTLSATGLFADVASLAPAPGLIEYDVASPLWSDRALKRRWIALPETERIRFSASGDWEFPLGTVFVKHFELPTSPSARVRVETRVLLRQVDRWVGYTYRWNAAQTEASLVTSEETGDYVVDVDGVPTPQTWLFPSPAGCLSCHTAAAGRVLGARTAQLNRPFAYPGGSDAQLHAWASCLGLFAETLQSPAQYGSYADPADTAEPLDARARSYLAANCAHCHAPLGPAPGGLDLRFGVLLGDMNLIGVAPTEGTLGLPDARRVFAGAKEQSVLWARIASTDPALHMPAGSLVPDPLALSLLGAWIDTGLATLDSDGDGAPDAADNCPYEPNAGQADAGTWLASLPDGIGDACQCLDVTPTAAINTLDSVRLRAYLTGNGALVTPGVERRSNHPEPAGRASILDVTRLRRALAGVDPPPAQVCPAASALQP